MKWKDLTAEQLLKLASDLDDHAHDMKFEREIIEEEQGFDLYGGYRCLARKLVVAGFGEKWPVLQRS